MPCCILLLAVPRETDGRIGADQVVQLLASKLPADEVCWEAAIVWQGHMQGFGMAGECRSE